MNVVSKTVAASFAVIAISALNLRAADSASEADKVFVGKVSQGGMYEVEASKVAEKMAQTADVRDVAHTEVHDHDGVNGRLKALADAAGIPVATELNTELHDRLEKLKAIPAADFDEAYIKDMGSIHDKDEKLFAKEADEGTEDFKKFAHETDLIVKRHIGALHGAD
jgi:putative membrane protein